MNIIVIAEIAGAFTAIITFVCLLVRPIRDKLFNLSDIKEGLRCQLRADIMRTYYRHKDEKTIRQYEAEHFDKCYAAYKALKGNSFIDEIYEKAHDWEVIP